VGARTEGKLEAALLGELRLGGGGPRKVSGPIHRVPETGCQSTMLACPPKRGVVDLGTHTPPAHAEPTASRLRLHPASWRQWRKLRGRGGSRGQKLTGERAEAGVEARRSAYLCAARAASAPSPHTERSGKFRPARRSRRLL
jgi:hypothetical protein